MAGNCELILWVSGMPTTHPGLKSSGLILSLSLEISQQMKRKDNFKCECWQILNDVIILNTKQAQSTQQTGHIACTMCSGYTVGEVRVSWIINSGGMRTMCVCVSVFSSSLQSLLRLIGSPSQTQGKSQECYLLVSHHIKGMSGCYSSYECVTDIGCSPEPTSLLQLSFHWYQGDWEKVWEEQRQK